MGKGKGKEFEAGEWTMDKWTHLRTLHYQLSIVHCQH